ncbi:polysaccharide deacetylase family protein [Nonomuraea terrae]|uniref:polysaccharide deacetylase family protein n=1 Tax=Nonomuraea terrae TaxID=2530383 RepID=UPI0037B6B31B
MTALATAALSTYLAATPANPPESSPAAHAATAPGPLTPAAPTGAGRTRAKTATTTQTRATTASAETARDARATAPAPPGAATSAQPRPGGVGQAVAGAVGAGQRLVRLDGQDDRLFGASGLLSAVVRKAWAEASKAIPLEPVLAGAGAPQAAERVDCRRVKCVALTFDDGPGPYTDALLHHLKAHRARATFFVVGRNVAANPAPVREAYAAGHEIGSHTWSHPDLTKITATRIRLELSRTDEVIKAAIGVTPKLVRPPYGAVNSAVRLQTTRPMVLWSVDTLDWRLRDSAKVARRTLASVRPGSVILFHDIHASTVRAMPRILKSLSKRGYRFVTVTRLFDGKPPGTVHGLALTDHL